jgi:phosphoribosylformimino-5-aminoimidazole carboxamide ribotide isomerase
MYKRDQLTGGHVIMLGDGCEESAMQSLAAYPQSLQIGGGINIDNATKYINAGASHVIVTSYVFRDGAIDYERLTALRDLVGKEKLVIDLSCRKKPNELSNLFYVVTNKWTKYTDFLVRYVRTLNHFVIAVVYNLISLSSYVSFQCGKLDIIVFLLR